MLNKIIKNFSKVLLLISVILLLFLLYRYKTIWSETLNLYYKDYYLNYIKISIFFIFLSFIFLFLNKEKNEYLFIFFASLIFTCYSFETYIVVKKKKSLNQLISNKNIDIRTQFQIFKDLNKKSNTYVVPIFPKNYLNTNQEIFPMSGISNSKTIHCNENGYYSIYESDRYGFNNPDQEWDKEKIHYLLIGDSFAHGACINRPNDIASVLRNLSKKNVINLGYGGNGPLIEYATLKEYYVKNVEKVLWIYTEANDLKDYKNEKKNKILKQYLNDKNFSQNLKIRQKEINLIARNILQERFDKNNGNSTYVKKNYKFIIEFLKLYNLRSSLIENRKAEKPDKDFEKILQNIKQFVIENNSKLYFVYLPYKSRYESIIDRYESSYKKIKKIVEKNNIPFIDIHELIQKEKNPLNFFPTPTLNGVHFSVDGYYKISEEIFKKIK